MAVNRATRWQPVAATRRPVAASTKSLSHSTVAGGPVGIRSVRTNRLARPESPSTFPPEQRAIRGSSAAPDGPYCRRSCPPNSVKATPGYPLPARTGPVRCPSRERASRTEHQRGAGRPTAAAPPLWDHSIGPGSDLFRVSRRGIAASDEAFEQSSACRVAGPDYEAVTTLISRSDATIGARSLSARCRETIHSARRTALAVGAWLCPPSR